MTTPVIPETYAQWRHCIEVECGIPLTPDFINARLQALAQPRGEEAGRFAGLYGAAHLERVIGWFRRAAAPGASG